MAFDLARTRGIAGSAQFRLVLVVSVLLTGFAVWRATLGVNLSDDAYSIVVVQRTAQGAWPLVDEQNLQVLGSLPAVPVAWLWLHLVGSTGLVLALRLFFVLVAGLVSLGCYRALRPDFPPAVAFAAVTVPVLALPYGLMVVSYNTVPMLATMFATCAGYAAVRRGSGRWGAASAAAAGGAVLGYPPILPAALAIVAMVAMLSRQRRGVLSLLGAGGGVAAVVCAWLLAIGPSGLQDVLRLGEAIRRHYGPVGLPKLLSVIRYYLDELRDLSYLPLGLLVLLAVLPILPRRPRRLQVLAAGLIPFAAILPAFTRLGPNEAGANFGVAPAQLGLLAGAALVPAALVLGRWDGSPVPTLIRIALPAAVLGVPVLAAATASGASRGVPVIGMTGLLAASVAGWGSVLTRHRPSASAAAAGVLVAAMAVLLALTPFQGPYPWLLTRRVTSGVYAGIQAQPTMYRTLSNLEQVGRRWVHPGEGYLVYGVPGAYLLFPGRPVTNVAWLTAAIPENQATLKYFARIHRRPDVILLADAFVPRRGLTAMGRRDPLIAFTLKHYRIVDRSDGLIVFRRI